MASPTELAASDTQDALLRKQLQDMLEAELTGAVRAVEQRLETRITRLVVDRISELRTETALQMQAYNEMLEDMQKGHAEDIGGLPAKCCAQLKSDLHVEVQTLEFRTRSALEAVTARCETLSSELRAGKSGLHGGGSTSTAACDQDSLSSSREAAGQLLGGSPLSSIGQERELQAVKAEREAREASIASLRDEFAETLARHLVSLPTEESEARMSSRILENAKVFVEDVEQKLAAALEASVQCCATACSDISSRQEELTREVQTRLREAENTHAAASGSLEPRMQQLKEELQRSQDVPIADLRKALQTLEQQLVEAVSVVTNKCLKLSNDLRAETKARQALETGSHSQAGSDKRPEQVVASMPALSALRSELRTELQAEQEARCTGVGELRTDLMRELQEIEDAVERRRATACEGMRDEISRFQQAAQQRLQEVDIRCAAIETALGWASQPPETSDSMPCATVT